MREQGEEPGKGATALAVTSPGRREDDPGPGSAPTGPMTPEQDRKPPNVTEYPKKKPVDKSLPSCYNT